MAEVACRSLACTWELVVAEVACKSRACAWALVVVEVTCRSLACALELVVVEVACRSRACAWALVVATDRGCWADEGELALEPSRPLVCRVTAASVSVRELIPEQLLGEEAGSQLAQPVGLSRLRLRAAPPSAH